MKKEGYRRKTTFEKKHWVSSGFARVMDQPGSELLYRLIF
jgi:hypothetical protein